MKLRTYVALGALTLSVGACDGLLDTQPKQSVTPEVVLNNFQAYRNLLASAYNRLQGFSAYGNVQVVAPEILSDNGVIAVNSGRYTDLAINSPGSGAGNGGGGWSTWYAIVNDANFVLAGIDGLEGAEATKNQYKGEAYFLRALAFHNLARIFSYEPGREVNGFNAGIVLRTEPTRDPAGAATKARSTNVETYNQIESDLNAAIAAFSQPGANSRNVFLANLAATRALASRVYLYWSKWAQAEAMATAALGSSGTEANTSPAVLTTTANHVASWAREPSAHQESFFEIAINPSTESQGVNNAISAYYLLPPNGQWFAVMPSTEFFNLFEANDVRRQLYPTVSATDLRRNTIKFSATSGNYADNVPVIRYSEVLLIRAEARAEQGNLAGALADVNTLRAARGAGALGAFASTAAAITAIYDERRRELGFEGHRWFDLKRRNLPLVKPAAAAVGTIQPNDFRWLDDIPNDQVQLSKGTLQQNPGY
ncbi:MAG TPA: RagB/SusD family nutrient uptake outer membrane protein [Rhodothermales bacterium]|nr:RagB/SusD family nutrient uptake outer membrane protein [Rhodothermales bacterium]